jgi:preprotein translocase SecE subunit
MADQPNKTVRARKVKNPESFRDRATKASVPKNSRIGKLKNIKRVFTPITAAFRRAHAQANNSKFLRPLRKPLKILGKILLINYITDSFNELKQVTWPSFKQSRKLTVAVLGFAIVFGTVIASVDWVLGKLAKDLLLK